MIIYAQVQDFHSIQLYQCIPYIVSKNTIPIVSKKYDVTKATQ